jgi:hypothetical protein
MEPHGEGLTQQDKLQAIMAVCILKLQLVKLNWPIRDCSPGFRWVMMVKMLWKEWIGYGGGHRYLRYLSLRQAENRHEAYIGSCISILCMSQCPVSQLNTRKAIIRIYPDRICLARGRWLS